MEESALALTRKYSPPQGALLANIEIAGAIRQPALGDTILRLAATRSASWREPTGW